MTNPGYGYLQPTDELGPLNPTAYVFEQMLSRARTLTFCVVKSLGAIGYVNVQPIVNMVDGNGNALEHGTIYSVPYLQMRAGTTAIVVAPIVGDIGLLAVCDRDISSAKTSLAPGPPPSGRMYDFSDSVYVMGLGLGTAPTHTITATPTGFVVSGNLTIEGNLLLGGSIGAAAGGVYAGNIATSGTITAGVGGADQVTLQLHEHSANNTPPTPGT
jgi:hypothetical protein